MAGAQLGDGAVLVLGADLRKSPDILIPAYDDARGVTAAFNLNLLHRINRELGADFDPDLFRHEARWNAAESRIEMHLVSTAAQTVTVAGRAFRFEPGETIHTENSRKFDLPTLDRLLASGGWTREATYMDAGELFSVLLLRRG